MAIFLFPVLAEFTASHFGGGGGLLRKKNAEEEGGGDGKPRSRQELIEELIIKSKQEKVGRVSLGSEVTSCICSTPCVFSGI